MFEKNRQKFLEIKALNLPLGQYAITGSGPLGIRHLREIGDIDIIVNSTLWDSLAEKFGVIEEKGIKKIVLPDQLIEVLGEQSYLQIQEENNPTIAERITKADIMEGLPFESLEHVVYFKRKMGREKDLRDILMIEAWHKDRKL